MQFSGLALFACLLSAATAVKISSNIRALSPDMAAKDPDAAHKALLALLSENGKEPLDATVASLASMAESIAKQDPSTKEQSVATIGTLTTGLLESIQVQWNITQTALNNNSAYDTCNAHKAADLEHAETLDNTTGEYSNTSALYAECLAELEIMNQSWLSCIAQEADLQAAMDGMCSYFALIDRSSNYLHWFCSEDDFSTTGTTYEEYLERSGDILNEFRGRQQNCTDATNAYNSKVAQCSGEKTLIDEKQITCANLAPGQVPANCGPYYGRVQACSSYDHCWTQANNAAAQADETAQALSVSLQAEWRAIKRIECLLEVIVSEGDQTAELEACIAKTHDASHLEIVSPDAPPKEECSAGTKPDGC